MSSIRKGRDFELSMHKELKKTFGDSIHVQKWSGTKEDPGDLYTDCLLIDCKNIQNYSQNDVVKWYNKLTEEAGTKRIPVIIHKSRRGVIEFLFDIKYLTSKHKGLARFNWDDGLMMIKWMEDFCEKARFLQEETS